MKAFVKEYKLSIFVASLALIMIQCLTGTFDVKKYI